jgi:thiosulfate reductase/polysulfide reductase chain A
MHTFGRTQTNPNLRALMAENEVWVNTRVAKDLGLENGKYVTLKNQDGVVSNRVKLRATERIRPDCVYMVHGFGHTSRMLTSAYRRGASTSQLLTRYNTDPLMGGTSVHTTFVTLARKA